MPARETGQLGTRLRELRVRAMLTQLEVAERMGVRQKDVWALEAGRVTSPSVRTLSRFLRTCGASWFDLAGALDSIEVPLDSGRWPKAAHLGLKRPDAGLVLAASERQSGRYRLAMRTTSRGKSPAPDKLERMARHLRNYRVVANVVEQAVVTALRLKPVAAAVYPQYHAVARHTLGILWRLAKTAAGQDALLKTRGRQPEQVTVAKTSRAAFWRDNGLDAKLVAEIQDIVLTRFIGLLRSCPELFGPSPRAGGNREFTRLNANPDPEDSPPRTPRTPRMRRTQNAEH